MHNIITIGKHRIKAITCSSSLSKARGLMFRSRPKNLLFTFRQESIHPLHMFFVFFPIDVLFLNKDKKIIEMKNGFKPWSFYTPQKRAQYILETKAGTIKKLEIKIGQTAKF